MAAKSPVPIQWECTLCTRYGFGPGTTHTINLLGKNVLNRACIEQQLPDWNIRPDIVCMSSDKPRVLIEIVDTHAPEQPVADAGLPVLEVHVSDAADLELLATGVVPVAAIHNYPCPDPPCNVCGRRKTEGCANCDRCGDHCDLDRHYHCDTCGSITVNLHRHRYCDECNADIVEELWDMAGHGGWTHLHCAGCGRLLRPSTLGCGCLKTECRPCWGKL